MVTAESCATLEIAAFAFFSVDLNHLSCIMSRENEIQKTRTPAAAGTAGGTATPTAAGITTWEPFASRYLSNSPSATNPHQGTITPLKFGPVTRNPLSSAVLVALFPTAL